MDKRILLQAKLEEILGSRNVYFQPPSNLQMRYPAIVYSRTNINATYANDTLYNHKVCYKVTVIDRDPENMAILKLLELPTCSYNNHYIVDNLNHDVFTIYY